MRHLGQAAHALSMLAARAVEHGDETRAANWRLARDLIRGACDAVKAALGPGPVQVAEYQPCCDRILELESALRGLLAYTDISGYMTPEHQVALWQARQALTGRTP